MRGRRRRYVVEFEGRDGPDPETPLDAPWLVYDREADCTVEHGFTTKREAEECARKMEGSHDRP